MPEKYRCDSGNLRTKLIDFVTNIPFASDNQTRHMSITSFLREVALDVLAKREGRFYWRQMKPKPQLRGDEHIVLWQPDGKLGDAVINSMIVADVLDTYPKIRLTIAAPLNLHGFWRRIPGVAAVVDSASSFRKNNSHELRPCDIFISLETFLSLSTVQAIKQLSPNVAIGLSVGQYRLFDYSIADNTYEHPRKHISNRLRTLTDLLGIEFTCTSPLPAAISRGLAQASPNPSSPNGGGIFINTYAASADRSFSLKTVDFLLRLALSASGNPDIKVSVFPENAEAITNLIDVTNEAHRISLVYPRPDIWDLIESISTCSKVITPDTAIAHLGAGLGKDVFVFYRDQVYNPIVWAPLTKRASFISSMDLSDVNGYEPGAATARLTGFLAS